MVQFDETAARKIFKPYSTAPAASRFRATRLPPPHNKVALIVGTWPSEACPLLLQRELTVHIFPVAGCVALSNHIHRACLTRRFSSLGSLRSAWPFKRTQSAFAAANLVAKTRSTTFRGGQPCGFVFVLDRASPNFSGGRATGTRLGFSSCFRRNWTWCACPLPTSAPAPSPARM